LRLCSAVADLEQRYLGQKKFDTYDATHHHEMLVGMIDLLSEQHSIDYWIQGVVLVSQTVGYSFVNTSVDVVTA
jgi:hypothetical protein